MRPSVATLLVILNLGLYDKAIASDWGYSGDIGPEHWTGYCEGNYQSPVNLEYSKAIFRGASSDPLIFRNYDKRPKESDIRNVESTIKMHRKYGAHGEIDAVPTVTGGGLPGEYAFEQLHFHWGLENNVGSEHQIDNNSYPAELHLVHYNLGYGKDLHESIANGVGAHDILAVLGVFFRIDSKPNEKLTPIIEVIKDLHQPDGIAYTSNFKLEDLLPEDTSVFFRYNGSLTTPGCNEIVVWTVFTDTIPISEEQLELFRTLSKDNENMRNNFRPTQPLNRRKVYEYHTSGSDRINGMMSVVFFLAAPLMISSKLF